MCTKILYWSQPFLNYRNDSYMIKIAIRNALEADELVWLYRLLGDSWTVKMTKEKCWTSSDTKWGWNYKCMRGQWTLFGDLRVTGEWTENITETRKVNEKERPKKKIMKDAAQGKERNPRNEMRKNIKYPW